MDTDGLNTTLRVLAHSENASALEVLTCALTAPEPDIQEGVLRSLLSRRDEAGHRAVLRHWPRFSEHSKSIVAEYPGRLLNAILEWMTSGNEQLTSIACDAALSAAEYDVAPTLATLAADEQNPSGELAAKSLVQLAESVFERACGPRNYRDRRDPQRIRARLNASLETALVQSPPPPRKEVVEAYLLTCDRDTPSLKRFLQEDDDLHAHIEEALLSNRRPGIVKLILDQLNEPHPPLALFRIVSQRADHEFLRALFTRMAGALTPHQKSNLGRISEVPWVRDDLAWLESLDERAQPGLVHTLTASGIPRHDALRAIAHLAKFGSLQGRLAVVGALTEFSGSDANDLILQALTDIEPQVQAAALVQLRTRRMPHALPRLIELLDSPHAIVREKACECLPEFTFPRYLEAFDLLDEEVAWSSGQLVRKVDGDTLDQLTKELTADRRARRRRAPTVAVALDLAGELEDILISLLSDDDAIVRSEAARALAGSATPAAIHGLRQALHDPNPHVRIAAEISLESLDTAPDAANSETQTDAMHNMPAL